jgi:hypothetical protein
VHIGLFEMELVNIGVKSAVGTFGIAKWDMKV